MCIYRVQQQHCVVFRHGKYCGNSYLVYTRDVRVVVDLNGFPEIAPDAFTIPAVVTRPVSVDSGLAELASRYFSRAGLIAGSLARTRAAMPETKGAAMDVPL